ncbi:MAG TPA: sulfur carrier protein ThiS [Baekduia sp.]|nr:sulfur carrier protein ThiS [Baekduia sp.]
MIIINGEPSDAVAPGATVVELLDALDVDGERGVAVAVDAEVIPRGEWPTFAVGDGARVEVLIAVQGG